MLIVYLPLPAARINRCARTRFCALHARYALYAALHRAHANTTPPPLHCTTCTPPHTSLQFHCALTSHGFASHLHLLLLPPPPWCTSTHLHCPHWVPALSGHLHTATCTLHLQEDRRRRRDHVFLPQPPHSFNYRQTDGNGREEGSLNTTHLLSPCLPVGGGYSSPATAPPLSAHLPPGSSGTEPRLFCLYLHATCPPAFHAQPSILFHGASCARRRGRAAGMHTHRVAAPPHFNATYRDIVAVNAGALTRRRKTVAVRIASRNALTAIGALRDKPRQSVASFSDIARQCHGNTGTLLRDTAGNIQRAFAAKHRV